MRKLYLENIVTDTTRKVSEKRTENSGNHSDQHLATQVMERTRRNSSIAFLKKKKKKQLLRNCVVSVLCLVQVTLKLLLTGKRWINKEIFHVVLHCYKEQWLYRAAGQPLLHKTNLEDSTVNSFSYVSIHAVAAEKRDDLTEVLHAEMP